jgi:thiopeptide-type bacteriocin biosynthesis protein
MAPMTDFALDELATGSALVPGRPPLPLVRFIEECASALDSENGLDARQRMFLDAGLTAVRHSLAGSPWTQFGLAVAPSRQRDFYRVLHRSASRLLEDGSARNFFYMHKPPGVRIRLEPTTGQREPLRTEVGGLVRQWQADGIVTAVEHGVYEPEEQLFGGKSSMAYVHRLFTADSLTWLDHFNRELSDCPPWLFSLYSIRSMLDGLGIVGWEDLQVWQRIRLRTGRRLSDEATETDQFRKSAPGIRKAWEHTRRPASDQVGTQPSISSCGAIRSAAEHWLKGHFQTAEADIGPRDGAAIAIIFHWNRGNLSPLKQGLLTEALAGQHVI